MYRYSKLLPFSFVRPLKFVLSQIITIDVRIFYQHFRLILSEEPTKGSLCLDWMVPSMMKTHTVIVTHLKLTFCGGNVGDLSSLVLLPMRFDIKYLVLQSSPSAVMVVTNRHVSWDLLLVTSHDVLFVLKRFVITVGLQFRYRRRNEEKKLFTYVV